MLLLNAPEGFELEGVKVVRRATGTRRRDPVLPHRAARARAAACRCCASGWSRTPALWIAWPKKASKRPTDITEDVVREIALANALVDNKVAAIDEIWSGLQLVIRVKDRLP